MFFYFLLSFLIIFIYEAFAMFLEVFIYDYFYFIIQLFLHTNRLYCQLFIFSCSIYYEIIYYYITI